MQISFTVREFANSDMERVRQIESQSLREITPIAAILRYYNIPARSFVVAEDQGRVVGFLVAGVSRNSEGNMDGRILSIAVDPLYRGKGVGTCLVEDIICVLRNVGARRLVLEVKQGNRAAQEFYRRLGFGVLCVVRGYYKMRGYREDAVVMFRDL